jgi:hypothetical protein
MLHAQFRFAVAHRFFVSGKCMRSGGQLRPKQGGDADNAYR